LIRFFISFALLHSSSSKTKKETIHIFHAVKTKLEQVGLQVWGGALLLADFLLFHEVELAGVHALELGCGPGLTGIVLSRVAQRVFLTGTTITSSSLFF
jgi:predicted nicotinamide N-methyase